ncbi:hypothetical protein GCM10023198_10470 [Promicromonospora umidemergens]|uniref:Uncharacterized protein n=1 Tax=Promicromonospora umidemergens TaxID=629679 RepID=A0ABP8WQP5_9MICO
MSSPGTGGALSPAPPGDGAGALPDDGVGAPLGGTGPPDRWSSPSRPAACGGAAGRDTGAGTLDDGGAAAGGAAPRSSTDDGGGAGAAGVPVVKSYPQFSQNSDPAGEGSPQLGQVTGPPDEASDGASDEVSTGSAPGCPGPAPGPAADAPAGMGVPHTSQ